MDKKLMKSISNFATALESLAEELKKQGEAKEETSKGLFSGFFSKNGLQKRMKKIQEGIKQIKEDTQEIIKNQGKLLKLNKAKDKDEKTGVFEKTGGKKQMTKIKEGVGTIILIAAAVLAIGMAFKLVAPVDVVSVLALAVAITAMGFAVSKMQENGMPTPPEALAIGLALFAFSVGVVASSWLMMLIPKIDTIQLLTFVGISLTFALMFKLGMNDLLKATKKIKPIQILFLPLILAGISLAIVASSYILQYVAPVEGSKLLNILAMGTILGLLAIIMSIPMFIIGKMGGPMIKGAILAIIILPAISLAIMLSSWLIGMGDYSKPLPIDWALSFGISMLILALPVAILGLVGPMAFIGALALIAISAAIAVSSYILSYVDVGTLNGVADSIAYFVDVVGGAIIRFAKDFLPILVSIATAFLTQILPPLSKFLREILPPLSNFLKTIIDSVMPAVLSIIDVAKVIVQEIDNIITSIAKVLDSVGGIIEKIGGVFAIIGDKIIGILGGIKDIIREVADSIVKVLNGVTDSLTRLSQLNAGNLLLVAGSLGAMGAGLGFLAVGLAALAVSEKASKFIGGGLEKVGEQLKSLSQHHKAIYLTGRGIEKLADGMEKLNEIEIDDQQVKNVLAVLDKISSKGANVNVETVNKQVIESGNLIEELKGLNTPQNKELISEIRLMRDQLSVIASNSSTISTQLNNLRGDSEPKIDF